MIVQIPCLDELQTGVVGGNFVGLIVNPIHQNAGKQEVGENHDPLETQHGALFQCRHDQRKGNA